MPELPEVETIRRGLEKELKDAIITGFEVRDRRLLSRAHEKKWLPRLTGQSLRRFHRHGKYLEIGLENTDRFIVHLRMTGQLLISTSAEIAAKPRFILTFHDGRALTFVDQRRFGEVWLLKSGDAGPSRAPLGPDALDITLADFKTGLRAKTGPIQAVLLDQSVLAGIGNIYAQEALFLAKIRPTRKTQRLKAPDLDTLHTALAATLAAAIQARGSSSRNYRDVYGEEGAAQIAHAVYQKAGRPCIRCHTSLRGVRVGGRSSVYCPTCQV